MDLEHTLNRSMYHDPYWDPKNDPEVLAIDHELIIGLDAAARRVQQARQARLRETAPYISTVLALDLSNQ